jgi:hypothetical protein
MRTVMASTMIVRMLIALPQTLASVHVEQRYGKEDYCDEKQQKVPHGRTFPI